MIEAWRSGLTQCARTKNKLLTVLGGIFKRAMTVFGLTANPVLQVEKLRARSSGDIDVW